MKIENHRLQGGAFWAATALLAIVPLTFWTRVYRAYTLPRFAVLLIGSAILLPLLVLSVATSKESRAMLKQRHVVLVALYLLVVALSSVFGVAPFVSVLGSFENQMGLVTNACFFLCFVALVIGIGKSAPRFLYVCWAMTTPGLLIGLYALAQSAGFDPFVPTRLYTYGAGAERVVRAVGTMGHADFLGNFLLYTAPLSAGLAFASKGRARRVALAGTGLSVAAIIVSGTRGAWLGLGVGVALFATLELGGRKLALPNWLRARRGWLLVVAALMLSGCLVILSPASRSVAVRARSLVSDRVTGAGRTILWRDSLRMVPAYALLGCGPEGFRKAFLPYKSRELARVSGKIQNESSHNSYIDAIISYGIAGIIAYAALIASTMALLLRARRAANRERSMLLTGIVSSFAAVLVHKTFIYDQISSGLYFFSFAALALSAANVVAAEAADPGATVVERGPTNWLLVGAAVAFGSTAIGAALWYSLRLLEADVEIRQAVRSVATADYEGVLAPGRLAVVAPDPTGGYHFLFARALAEYATKSGPAVPAANSVADFDASRNAAIDLAISEANQSIKQGNSPDSGYLLLCYLESAKKDYGALRTDAASAVAFDGFSGPAHSFLAEACLAQGDVDGADREISVWMGLRRRAGAYNENQRQNRVQGFIGRSSALSAAGNLTRARLELFKATAAARDRCPPCHRSLAIAYEDFGLFERAIDEWESLIRLSTVPVETESAQGRIKLLMQRTGGSRTP